jgi:hypothetical protein
MYINNIINLFNNFNFNIYTFFGKPPDDDLLFSFNFNYFTHDNNNSQYFRLIEDVNKIKNKNFKNI